MPQDQAEQEQADWMMTDSDILVAHPEYHL